MYAQLTLISKQALESRRRQLGIAHCMLDRLMAQIGLDHTGIDAVVGQLEPTGMAQHVRVNLHVEASGLAGAF
jgi:ribulose 1,5-bisphosphate carboxylase large subunit-like protein